MIAVEAALAPVGPAARMQEGRFDLDRAGWAGAIAMAAPDACALSVVARGTRPFGLRTISPLPSTPEQGGWSLDSPFLEMDSFQIKGNRLQSGSSIS